MRSRARWSTGWTALVGVVILGIANGCERWPWETSTAEPPAIGQSPAQPPAGTPATTNLFVPPQERAAAVNQTPISVTEIELAVAELKRILEAYKQEWKPLPIEEQAEAFDLVDVLNNVVDTELKAQDARARGLDRKTDIQRRLAYLQRTFYAQEWDRWQRERAVPTDEQIHTFYEQNKKAFEDPERIRVRQIVTPTLNEAESVRTRAVQGADFAQLAREVSIGPGKEHGGDIGWHLRRLDSERLRIIGSPSTDLVFFQQLEPLAFSLQEPAQISQPVKGPDGRYYLVLLTERKPARQQSELEVRESIKEVLTAQHIQQQLEQVRQKGKIELFPERLADVHQDGAG